MTLEEIKRRVAELTPHEQAEIAEHLRKCLCEDELLETAERHQLEKCDAPTETGDNIR